MGVIFALVGRLGWRLWLVVSTGMVCWLLAASRFQPPLPRLLYSQDNHKALYLWGAGCASPLMTCAHERLVLEGLNTHPVAHWSPDGASIAVYLAESWVIYPTDCLLAGGECQPARFDPAANDNRIAWGPDGSTLAYIADSSSAILKILTRGCWDERRGQGCHEREIELVAGGVLRQAAWSADGSRLAFLGLKPRGLFVLDAACLDDSAGCANQIQYVDVKMWPVYWPSLSADGSQLLYVADSGDGVEQVFIAQVDTQAVEQISFRTGGGNVPAWSADGRYIAFAGFDNRSGGDLGIYLFDLERRLTARAIRQPGYDFAYPAWNPIP